MWLFLVVIVSPEIVTYPNYEQVLIGAPELTESGTTSPVS